MESVALLVVGDAHKFRHISVGYKIHIGNILKKLVAVLYNHKLVALCKPLLFVEDSLPYPLVVPVGPAVGAAEHHSLIQAIFAYCIGDCLY